MEISVSCLNLHDYIAEVSVVFFFPSQCSKEMWNLQEICESLWNLRHFLKFAGTPAAGKRPDPRWGRFFGFMSMWYWYISICYWNHRGVINKKQNVIDATSTSDVAIPLRTEGCVEQHLSYLLPWIMGVCCFPGGLLNYSAFREITVIGIRVLTGCVG